MKAALFWSGGKDSAYALQIMRVSRPEVEIALLVTTLNEKYRRISMHGIREELPGRQAQSIGLPLYKMWVPDIPTNESYEKVLANTLRYLKNEGFDHVVFGDIFLEDIKTYREKLVQKFGLTALFPLWKKNTMVLLRDFIAAGFETLLCCVNSTYLGKEWLGNKIDQTFLDRLPLNVDPCGENGEFHTFCYAGPVFKSPVNYTTGKTEYKSLNVKTPEQEIEYGFWYLDLY